MVGEERRLELKEVLNEKQIHHVLEQAIGEDVPWKLETSEIKPAMDGIAGFLGEHLKAVLHVDVKGEKKKVHLFLKCVPKDNKGKAQYIDELHLFGREQLMFKLLEKICTNGSYPWRVKAYIYTDSIIVMPDLTVEGYTTRSYLHTLDIEHVFVSTTTIARFHAAFVNYETKRSIDLNCPYNTFQEYGEIFTEALNNPKFIKSCSKLSVTLLKAFSTTSYYTVPDLETKLTNVLTEACDTLIEYKDTLNVLLHRDLWVNNIMYKYENDVPVNAVLVDYQLLRYGPPTFDLMTLLCLTTDRRLREEREKDVFDHYYSVFVNNLSEDSNVRLEGLGYDKENFLKWCEKSRMFGMLVSIAIYPFILMDPKTAQKTFDDPETFYKHFFEDRSEPVLAYANKNEIYKLRNLAVIEEFVERYVLNQL